ncbi:MAG: hypothetical protein AAGA93_19825 [Actinomycetota bacterium]
MGRQPIADEANAEESPTTGSAVTHDGSSPTDVSSRTDVPHDASSRTDASSPTERLDPTGSEPDAHEPTALPTMHDLRVMAVDLDDIDETLVRLDADPFGDDADPVDPSPATGGGQADPDTAGDHTGPGDHPGTGGDGQEPDFAIR